MFPARVSRLPAHRLPVLAASAAQFKRGRAGADGERDGGKAETSQARRSRTNRKLQGDADDSASQGQGEYEEIATGQTVEGAFKSGKRTEHGEIPWVSVLPRRFWDVGQSDLDSA
jgi:uncharacterized protein involved in outer membrane biogenesis